MKARIITPRIDSNGYLFFAKVGVSHIWRYRNGIAEWALPGSIEFCHKQPLPFEKEINGQGTSGWRLISKEEALKNLIYMTPETILLDS